MQIEDPCKSSLLLITYFIKYKYRTRTFIDQIEGCKSQKVIKMSSISKFETWIPETSTF